MVEKFTTNLHVDKKIVTLLSKSTYQKSLASSVRELVSNAYDADALSVFVRINENYKVIEIEDDGNGMTRSEFEKYLTLAGTKSKNEYTRKYKRKRIGQFGIGFLSIFPYCEALEVVTTVENSDEVLSAIIPAIDYTEESTIQETNLEDIPINGNIVLDKSQRLKHYTKIRLLRTTYHVKQYFSKPKTRKRDSIITESPMKKFQWELQEDLPISYDPEKKSFGRLKYQEPIGINVFVNNKQLYRNELNDIILEQGVETVAGIECKYIFTTDYKSIKPLEARGIKKRVNNVGVGIRTDFELKRDRGYSRLHWIAGEIQYSEKIKPHLNISRDTFVSGPIIDAIDEFFATKLRSWAYEVEDIAVAEKAIEQTVKDTKKGRVTPKEEVISDNIKSLQERGFTVIKKKGTKSESSGKKQTPVRIDKEKKTVTIIEGDSSIRDYINVLGKEYEIVYTNKGFSANTPCRFNGRNVIEVNSHYELFKSKTYGNLFRKLHIYLLISSQKNNSASGMYKHIVENFKKEFGNLK